MTLLEILVKELPKRGGWPDGVTEIWQDYDGLIRPGKFGWLHHQIAEDHRRKHEDAHVKINRKQYEAALSAPKKPEWNGEGLPPVGVECEVSVDGGKSWCTYKAISERNGLRLVEIGDFTEDFQNNNWAFRPLRSEADRKRDAAIEEMRDVGLTLPAGIRFSVEEMSALYDLGFRKSK